jgi:glutamate-1-semialdehyde 2,1-aminomutase
MLDRGVIERLSERERAELDRRTPCSGEMSRRARRVLPAGVVSSFQARAPWPVYLSRGEGPRVWDLDGNEYVDLHNGFSAMVQGHAHPVVNAAVAQRLSVGSHFAAATQDAVVVAEELARRFGLPLWRFANSGTEASMTAIRVARAHTGRDDVLKIAGGYQGHHDVGMAGVSAGVPGSLAREVHTVDFNDAAAMERRIEDLAAEDRTPACVLMEPAMTGIGLVRPQAGYLESVRDLTRRHGVVLIFDEVKTGLTIAAGGGTERFGVQPDMVTLAKALGAGLPTGAVGMSEDLAAGIEDGSVPQLGTFNGNPLGMAAARASLLEILTPEAYAGLERQGEQTAAEVHALLEEHRIPAHVTGLGSKGSVSYGSEVVVDHPAYLRRHDRQLAELIWTFAMNRGVYTTPGREQEWNLSVAHKESEVARYLEVFEELADELTRRRSGSARA